MTNKDPGVEYDNSPNVFPFMLEQYTKRLYTAMPGEIVSYDANTRRASVRGSLQVVMDGGTQLQRPVIPNVPVVFQQAMGFLLEFPLVPGDSVLLVFSMRGLSRWKRTHGESAPDVDGLLSERDAVALPGFGPVGSHVPDQRIVVSNTGIAIHGGTITIDGATNVAIDGTSAVTIDGGSVTITGTTTVNGVSVANAPAGTDSASGPGGHSHGLTGA